MHLKTLTLRGFKSFASATRLNLEPGITCVVGPNGSGKSNVVDALAWVMGEHSAKTLRGGAMADVIFAGTSSRPPLGRAAVSLTIDNTDGVLPIEYAEVTISRTLFRSGGSEYAINGSPCRLLDIQELLSDTGMGREMHVIVGQGRLDAVLAASAEDRRGFIEEAAGILKHRKRKDKALRKLDATAANLARLTDLAGEIRRQLGPLAKQADVARRAQTVQVDLRDAKARLLADDIAQAAATLEQDKADEEALCKRRETIEAAQDEARAALAGLEAEAQRAAPELGEASQTWYRLSSLAERLKATQSLATERHRLLGSETEVHRSGTDPDELEERAERAQRAEDELAAERDEASEQLASATKARNEAEAAAAAAAKDLAAIERARADRREGLAQLSGRVATLRSKVEASSDELSRLKANLAEAEERRTSAEEKFSQLEQTAIGAQSGEEGLDKAHEQALENLRVAEEELQALHEADRAAKADAARWQARLEALELSLARKDATAHVLQLELPGVLGPLGELLTIEEGYADAIAAALGSLADAAVVDSLDTAIDAIRAAREAEAGMARLFVLESGGERATAAPPPAGVWAASVVSAQGALIEPLHRALAQTVIVTDLATAAQVRAADPRLTAVTTGGDILAPGRAEGGWQGGPSVLQIHSARDEARNELERATKTSQGLRFRLTPATEAVAEAKQAAEATLADLHASDANLAAVADQLGQLGSAIRAAQGEQERVTPRIAAVEAELSTRREELAQVLERLAMAEAEPSAGDGGREAAEAARDQREAESKAARTEETDARLVLRTLEERLKSISGKSASLRRAAKVEREARIKARERAERRAEQSRVALAVADASARALTQIARSLELAQARKDEAEAARTQREEKLTELRAKLDELGKAHAEVTDVVHRDEVARESGRLRLEQLEERAISELGLETEVLLAEYGPDQPVPEISSGDEEGESRPYVRAEQEKRLKKAERALKLLGKVNPLALEEHAALEERHKFLTSQINDVKKSRGDLMDIVRQIDERVQQVFAEAFTDTAREFEGVFSRLFPGGQGKLVLTDPADLLTTGIEVEARPPGKKVKRLSLLSGGERSLTAVALLVAIFKARPSPFYVMDEVEAALDDVNLSRLLEIFRELRADSQLIVVTHQKRTMEIADALYGVTMRGDGVTQVISQRIHEDA